MTSLEDEADSKKFEGWKESSMERHDLYNFETKIDYFSEKTKKQQTSYLLDTYFFIPQSLQINNSTYSKEQFFSDINNRIRFKINYRFWNFPQSGHLIQLSPSIGIMSLLHL